MNLLSGRTIFRAVPYKFPFCILTKYGLLPLVLVLVLGELGGYMGLVTLAPGDYSEQVARR